MQAQFLNRNSRPISALHLQSIVHNVCSGLWSAGSFENSRRNAETPTKKGHIALPLQLLHCVQGCHCNQPALAQGLPMQANPCACQPFRLASSRLARLALSGSLCQPFRLAMPAGSLCQQARYVRLAVRLAMPSRLAMPAGSLCQARCQARYASRLASQQARYVRLATQQEVARTLPTMIIARPVGPPWAPRFFGAFTRTLISLQKPYINYNSSAPRSGRKRQNAC